MKHVTVLASVLAMAVGAAAQDKANWIHDWNEGIKAAKDSGKPIFVMFTAEW